MKEGWKYKKLGEVCVKITDGSHNPPKGVVRSNNIMLSSQNVQNGYLDMTSVRYLSDADFMFENQRTKASKGDVLLTIVGTIGRTCVLKGDEGNITFQRSVAILKPSKEILSYYLMYYLLSQSSRLNTKAQGAAQKGIYLKQLGAYDISYPSIEEQQRIVSRLDSAFAHIDELKANAEKQLSEARALFQKALTKAMEPKEGWEEKTFGEVGSFSRGINFSKSDFVEDGFPCIHYGQIHTRLGVVTQKHLTCISPNLVRSDKLASKGDIIIAITSEDVEGSCKCTAWLGDYDISVGAHAAIYKHSLNPAYVSYYMKSAMFQKGKEPYVHGFKVMEIKPSDIAKIPIVFPSAEEQQRIVSRLDSLSAHVRELEEVLQKTIAECDALKQALLRKVFE